MSRRDEIKQIAKVKIRRLICLSVIMTIVTGMLSIICKINTPKIAGEIVCVFVWIVAILSLIATVISIICLFVVIFNYICDVDIVDAVKNAMDEVI